MQKRATPYITPTAQRYLSPEVRQATFDKDYQTQHPYEAAVNTYDPYDFSMRPLTQGLRNSISPFLGRQYNKLDTAIDNNSPWPMVGATALGAGGGYLLNKLINPNKKFVGDGTASLLGGLGGLGLSYLFERTRNEFNKTASYGDYSQVLSMLNTDPTMGFSEKAAIQQALSQLTSGDLTQLKQHLGFVMGAGVGLAIARFLGSKGLITGLLGAIVGGAIGYGAPSTRQNSLGQYIQ